MPKVEILNYSKHGALRLDTALCEEYRDLMSVAVVSVDELPRLVLDFPVFIKKNDKHGRFELVAIMGFQAGENLFVGADGWRASYIPRDVQRWPFQACSSSEGLMAHEIKEFKLGIDVENPRVSTGTQGELLFRSNGEPAACLESAIRTLSSIVRGSRVTKDFLDKMLALDLIEKVRIKLSISESRSVELPGMYSISPERLKDLGERESFDLLANDFLSAIYAIYYSQGHMGKLIAWAGCRN